MTTFNAHLKLQMLTTRAKQYEAVTATSRWLPKNPSTAFLCCIGAGPWKFKRRRAVQLQALTGALALMGCDGDLHDLSDDVNLFPLAWQNKFTRSAIQTTRTGYLSWRQFVESLAEHPEQAHDRLAATCGARGQPKVLSLFLRDFVGVKSFPVDRHVARALERHGLPTTEAAMLELCAEHGFDPVPIARMLVGERIDRGNPDWSRWPEEAAPE